MDLDHILTVIHRHAVQYLLIGGMNFLLRHEPVITYDVDLWIEDTVENRGRCELALAELSAQWGASDDDWGPVQEKGSGWLDRQSLFCLTSPHGAIDVFRYVRGLNDWQKSRANAVTGRTASSVPYLGLSDEDMLVCQLALGADEQKADRVETLRRALREQGGSDA